MAEPTDQEPLAVLRDDSLDVVQVHPAFVRPLREAGGADGGPFPRQRAGVRVEITVPGREGTGTLVPPPWEQSQ